MSSDLVFKKNPFLYIYRKFVPEKPWYSLSVPKKLKNSHSVIRTLDTALPHIEMLAYRHRLAAIRFIKLTAIYYLRFFLMSIVSIGVFVVSYMALTPTQTPDFMMLLGLFFIPLSSVVLGSAFGTYVEGPLDELDIEVDELIYDIHRFGIGS